jgi:ABC-type antimicrobial peptide transport system permease subunit
MRVRRHLEALSQDLRFSVRLWLREPASTAAVLVTLASSVGGIAVGLPLALGSLRAAGSLLYGVTSWQPVILAGVLTIVTVVAVLAALVPAGSAARTDAWNALRSE